MKDFRYNSNTISAVPSDEINPFELKMNKAEKRKAKGMFKSIMGMFYFVTLMYSLFVLLT